MATKQQFQPPSNEFLYKLGFKFSRDLLSHDNCDVENYLWRAVVVNALEDTMIDRTDRKSATLKTNAHNWIISNSKDFDRVCNWAMLDPDNVVSAYKKAITLDNIRFQTKHVYWHRYNHLLKCFKGTQDIVKKKTIRKKMRIVRKEAIYTSCVFISNVFLSVIT
tara:strand:+ start:615 stop:1106 length:492 start_codon:yes stop_codon:yes gene_type:complete